MDLKDLNPMAARLHLSLNDTVNSNNLAAI